MSKKVIPFLILAFFLSIHSFGQIQDSDPSQSFANGDFSACIKSCDELLKSNVNDSLANFYKGASLIRLKEFQQAKKCLTLAQTNNYQPAIAVNVNLLRAYAGLQETPALMTLLNRLTDNGFRALFVFNNEEFEYLNDNDEFNMLKTKIDANANPCQYGEEYKRLDFWLGEWDVYVNDSKSAESSITKSEGGCTLYEDYKTTGGFLGRSTNYYDPADKKYTQIWIDKFNSIIIFKEVASRKGYLLMSSDAGDGNLTRMTYVLDPATGNITQTMEGSTDNGKVWANSFVGVYKKRSHTETTAEHTEISTLIDQLDKALVARDYVALDKYYSEQLSLIAPNGMVLTKEMALAPFKISNKKSSLKSISNEDVQITLKENHAYAIMKTTHSFTDGNDQVYKNSCVFGKGKAGWQLELVSSILLSK